MCLTFLTPCNSCTKHWSLHSQQVRPDILAGVLPGVIVNLPTVAKAGWVWFHLSIWVEKVICFVPIVISTDSTDFRHIGTGKSDFCSVISIKLYLQPEVSSNHNILPPEGNIGTWGQGHRDHLADSIDLQAQRRTSIVSTWKEVFLMVTLLDPYIDTVSSKNSLRANIIYQEWCIWPHNLRLEAIAMWLQHSLQVWSWWARHSWQKFKT